MKTKKFLFKQPLDWPVGRGETVSGTVTLTGLPTRDFKWAWILSFSEESGDAYTYVSDINNAFYATKNEDGEMKEHRLSSGLRLEKHFDSIKATSITAFNWYKSKIENEDNDYTAIPAWPDWPGYTDTIVTEVLALRVEDRLRSQYQLVRRII